MIVYNNQQLLTRLCSFQEDFVVLLSPPRNNGNQGQWALIKRLSRPQTSLWSFKQQVRSEQGKDEASGRGFSRSDLTCC